MLSGIMLDALTKALFSKSYQYDQTLVLRQLGAILSVLCAIINVLWSVLLECFYLCKTFTTLLRHKDLRPLG